MCSEVKPKGKRDDSFFSLSSLFAWFKIKGYFEGAFCGLLCVYFVFHAYQQNKSYVSIWLSFIFFSCLFAFSELSKMADWSRSADVQVNS